MMITRNYLFESGDDIEINYKLVWLIKMSVMGVICTRNEGVVQVDEIYKEVSCKY